MRVISQDGKYNFPYENVIVTISDDRFIFAYWENGCPFMIAEYTSLEKSEKAMQKLHECYTGILLMQNLDFSEDVAEQLKGMTRGFICVNNPTDNVRIEPLHTVFRFPQEDEI